MAYVSMSPAPVNQGPAARAPYPGRDPDQQMMAWILQNAGNAAATLKGQGHQARLADLLMGGQPQMGPTLPGDAGGLQGLQRDRPGLAAGSGMDPREIEALLVMDPTGRLALQTIEARRPEPITPYQQANLDLQRQGMDQAESQFGEQMDFRRSTAASDEAYRRAKLALDQAELGAGGQVKLSDVAGIRKEYTGASEDFVKMRDAYGKITAAGEDVSPAGDLSLIFNFMKMLDPGSTVREGEFAQVAASGALGEQWTGWGNMLITGQRLTDAQRSDVLAQTANTMRSQLGHQLRTVRQPRRGVRRAAAPRDARPDRRSARRRGRCRAGGVGTAGQSAPAGRRGRSGRAGRSRRRALGMGSTGEAQTAPQAGEEPLDLSSEIEAGRRRIEALRQRLGR